MSKKYSQIVKPKFWAWYNHIVLETGGRVFKRAREGLRTVWVSKIIRLKSVNAPAWCAVPSDTGTYDNKVEMPRVTYKSDRIMYFIKKHN